MQRHQRSGVRPEETQTIGNSTIRATPYEGHTGVKDEHYSCLHRRLFQNSIHQTWSIPRGRPRLHTPTAQIYRTYKSMMIYDIRTQPRKFQQSYQHELLGQDTQTSMSDQYMVIQVRYQRYQKQRPQSLHMRKCHRTTFQHRHRLQI